MIRATATGPGGAIHWATISYGWERPEFYQAWGVPDECDGPFLDPLNPQTVHSTALLDSGT